MRRLAGYPRQRDDALLPLSGSQCSSPLPDNLGLNGAAAFGAVKQENGEDSQELSAASILFCRLLELCSVVAQRAHCDATLGRFFPECKCFLEGRGYGRPSDRSFMSISKGRDYYRQMIETVADEAKARNAA